MQAATLSTTSFGSVYWSDIQDAYIYIINRKFDVDDMPPPARGCLPNGRRGSSESTSYLLLCYISISPEV